MSFTASLGQWHSASCELPMRAYKAQAREDDGLAQRIQLPRATHRPVHFSRSLKSKVVVDSDLTNAEVRISSCNVFARTTEGRAADSEMTTCPFCVSVPWFILVWTICDRYEEETGEVATGALLDWGSAE